MINKSLKNQKKCYLLNKLIINILNKNKAKNIISINLIGKTSLTDYIIIASGYNSHHVSALANYLNKNLKKEFNLIPSIEGIKHSDWVLFDCGDIIIHIFRPEVREFYSLEKIWLTK